MLVLITTLSVAWADVTFIHEVEAEDLFSGKKAITLTTGYGADGIYMGPAAGVHGILDAAGFSGGAAGTAARSSFPWPAGTFGSWIGAGTNAAFFPWIG